MSEQGLQTTEKKEKSLVQAFDLTKDNLPDLSTARVVPADLTMEYWSPGEAEAVLCFYQGIDIVQMPNINDKDIIEDVTCAVLLTQLPDKSLKVYINAQTRLVSALKDAEKSGKIQVGTPIQVTFKGLVKNKSNGKESGRWAINPLSA